MALFNVLYTLRDIGLYFRHRDCYFVEKLFETSNLVARKKFVEWRLAYLGTGGRILLSPDISNLSFLMRTITRFIFTNYLSERILVPCAIHLSMVDTSINMFQWAFGTVVTHGGGKRTASAGERSIVASDEQDHTDKVWHTECFCLFLRYVWDWAHIYLFCYVAWVQEERDHDW